MNDHLLKKMMRSLCLILGITGFFIVATPLSAQALEHWHLPLEKELKTLRVQNRDSQPHLLWISGPIEALQEPLETSFEVPAFGSLEIPLHPFAEKAWIHIKTQESGRLQIQVLTSTSTSFLLNPGPGQRWKGRVRPQSEAVLLNLAPFSQTLRLLSGKQTQSWTLPAFGKIRISLSHLSPASPLSFEGEARIAGLLLSPLEIKALTADPTPVTLPTAENPEEHYFRLSNKSQTQSYVVRLTDPLLVAQARNQILQPNRSLARILIAEIDYGSAFFNRDFSAPRKTPWSWQISRAIKFTELASQECDGSPDMLEEFLKPWKENSGVICFWNYRIQEELTLQQIKNGRDKRPPALEFLPPALRVGAHPEL